MFQILIFVLVSAFLALLILNVYFRVKVFKYYKILVQNRVEFEVKQLLNKRRLEEEVLTRYPAHSDTILAFAGNIRRSVFIAVVLFSIIGITALILYYFQ